TNIKIDQLLSKDRSSSKIMSDSAGIHETDLNPSYAPTRNRSKQIFACLLKLLMVGVTLSLGILLIVVSIVLVAVFPSVFRSRIASSMPLVNGSFTFKAWNSPSTPIYMQFWLFSITNPQEFLSGGKPLLNDVGPFTYQERRVKSGVEFNSNGSVLRYQQSTFYHFRRDLSCCWEDTNVTTLNLMYVGLTHKMQYSSSYVKNIANNLLRSGKHRLVMTRPAKQILWGYHDVLLKTMQPIARLAGATLKSELGLFADKNGSLGDPYQIRTGADDVNRLGEIITWKGLDRLLHWNSSQANMINGTDGAMFPPFVSRSDLLYLFSSDICRSIYLKYRGDVMLHNTVPLYRFQAPAEMFMNATLNPSNRGFCLDGRCLDSGVLNISACAEGAPILMSQPHFYQAAAQYQDALGGLSPGPEFDTVLDVEPNTGLVMRAAKKLQINMAVTPSRQFADLQNLNSTLIMPLAWLNESACLDPESAGKFRAGVLQPRDTVARVQWSLLAIGFLLCGLALLCLGFKCRRRYLRQRAGPRSLRLCAGKASFASTSSTASPCKRGSLAANPGNGLVSNGSHGGDMDDNTPASTLLASASASAAADAASQPLDDEAETAETVIGAGA
ncbi:hypothetical protein BOX15_Mlig007247g2, partial [Macrostomum lignano]